MKKLLVVLPLLAVLFSCSKAIEPDVTYQGDIKIWYVIKDKTYTQIEKGKRFSTLTLNKTSRDLRLNIKCKSLQHIDWRGEIFIEAIYPVDSFEIVWKQELICD